MTLFYRRLRLPNIVDTLLRSLDPESRAGSASIKCPDSTRLASALSGKVNNHYLQTFGMAMAVGAIAGLAQIGNNGATYSPWYGFREGVSQQTALSSEQILNRYLNRYPTITIRPGSRVKVVLLADLPDVPEYAHHTMPVNR